MTNERKLTSSSAHPDEHGEFEQGRHGIHPGRKKRKQQCEIKDGFIKVLETKIKQVEDRRRR